MMSLDFFASARRRGIFEGRLEGLAQYLNSFLGRAGRQHKRALEFHLCGPGVVYGKLLLIFDSFTKERKILHLRVRLPAVDDKRDQLVAPFASSMDLAVTRMDSQLEQNGVKRGSKGVGLPR